MAEHKQEFLFENYRSYLEGYFGYNLEQVIVIRERNTHTVYRIHTPDGSHILKCFRLPQEVKEIRVYELLTKYHVPTLQYHVINDSAILLEDLNQSQAWRSASEADLRKSTTGNAVADWYKKLHASGFSAIRNPDEDLNFLQPWIDTITIDKLDEAKASLGITGSSGWNLAVSNLDPLIEKYRSFHQTFNYDDFAAENLALSRTKKAGVGAVVFDYDQFTVGAVYSDWRNVTYSLKDDAREAFIDSYGPVSEIERRLDNILSVFQGLITASKREKLPKWAFPLLDSIDNGEFETFVRAALEII